MSIGLAVELLHRFNSNYYTVVFVVQNGKLVSQFENRYNQLLASMDTSAKISPHFFQNGITLFYFIRFSGFQTVAADRYVKTN